MVEEKLSRYKKYKESYTKYKKENKERLKKQKREWYKRNKDKLIQYRKEHNNLIRFGGMKDIVLERDNWQCVKCGMNQEQHIIVFGRSLTIDHIDGRGRNSYIKNNSLDNLQTLCLRCHTMEENRRKKEKK